jgi:hypothetical protein
MKAVERAEVKLTVCGVQADPQGDPGAMFYVVRATYAADSKHDTLATILAFKAALDADGERTKYAVGSLAKSIELDNNGTWKQVEYYFNWQPNY